ncbi:hypothetical protein GCM10025865_15680 [Paraoerskovia sediminicola]|uniref:Fructose-bisphosphate aldolase n=1 Tax=Paraoerskovia sediminicola TaxID=1138587 RepID=A0ABM8G2N9_9CELL|nr:hypothetical protein GCM10025865_15680 [Paraoerskovia sediminicola]
MAPVLAACREIAAAAAVPVSVHLDHFQDLDLTREGIERSTGLGVSSVMVDAAHLADEENVATTRALTDVAHGAGLWVEAELGEVGARAVHTSRVYGPTPTTLVSSSHAPGWTHWRSPSAAATR